MMGYETAETQKEEFRKYLEKNGILSHLTRVLVGLYEEPERPAIALDYIRRYIGAPTGVDVQEMKAENDELRQETGELQTSIDALKQQLADMKEEKDHEGSQLPEDDGD